MRRVLLVVAALLAPALLAGCAWREDARFATFATVLPVGEDAASAREPGAFLVGASSDERSGEDPFPGDGRAAAWTLVFALREASELLCLHVDAASRAVADEESRALPGRGPADAGHTGFLEAGLAPSNASSAVDSDAVVQAARANATFVAGVERAAPSSWRVTLVGVGSGSLWAVTASGGNASATAAVDAVTGRVLHVTSGAASSEDAGCGA